MNQDALPVSVDVRSEGGTLTISLEGGRMNVLESLCFRANGRPFLINDA